MDGIDYFVTKTFGEGLYSSCKDVKFGTMNTRAIDFIGAGAKNFKGDSTICGRLYQQSLQKFSIVNFVFAIKVAMFSVSHFQFSFFLYGLLFLWAAYFFQTTKTHLESMSFMLLPVYI